MKKIFFTVTTDLTYDQRMIRICTSLANEGYKIVLVGRELNTSIPLSKQPFDQKRLYCWFSKGKGMYLEFNIRLFFYLFFKRMAAICAIDLDTILPCYAISKLKKIPRIYDAHELFCEMKEVVTRPEIYKIWKGIERFTVPKFHFGYTVNTPIAEEFAKMYGRNYQVIRNVPILKQVNIPPKPEKFILYQGSVNEGRSFETLIPAMRNVNSTLHIYGDGNFFQQANHLIKAYGLENKVFLKGKLAPGPLREVTLQAWIGVTFFENKGLSNYYSLANRFFDYMHAGIPQLCVDYPVYREINNHFEIALLISDLSIENISVKLNELLENKTLYQRLQENSLKAREFVNWQSEEKKLISIYKEIFLRSTI
jgi:glycosyltransferase involved in cell wall biosynthesis